MEAAPRLCIPQQPASPHHPWSPSHKEVLLKKTKKKLKISWEPQRRPNTYCNNHRITRKSTPRYRDIAAVNCPLKPIKKVGGGLTEHVTEHSLQQSEGIPQDVGWVGSSEPLMWFCHSFKHLRQAQRPPKANICPCPRTSMSVTSPGVRTQRPRPRPDSRTPQGKSRPRDAAASSAPRAS